MSDVVKAVVLGFVQGATEFLPVSSSGHLIALKQIFRFDADLAFDVCLHIATLVAVFIYFGRELVRLARSADAWPIAVRVIVGTIPAGLIGWAIEKQREHTPSWFVVVGWAISATYLFLTANRGGSGTYARLTLFRAFLIGGSQGIAAALPGFSRSGISISSGLWLGLERKQAFAFSFLLAIPVILGAGLVDGLKLFRGEASPVPGGWPALAAAMVAAFAVGLVAIHVVYRAVVGNRFHRFGLYNLTAGVLFAIYLATR